MKTKMRMPEFKREDQQQRTEDQKNENSRKVQPPPSPLVIHLVAIFARAHGLLP